MPGSPVTGASKFPDGAPQHLESHHTTQCDGGRWGRSKGIIGGGPAALVTTKGDRWEDLGGLRPWALSVAGRWHPLWDQFCN